ncbi:MAG: hypothetical protein J0H53_05375 [Rhizobiales bacterium]|nr:hypothetical protein [Hyphomicrobiales bacterium]OJU37162.1 MAG: hypothetical protein BGN94_08215 [Rhizobiales bacterium 68-8]
MDHDTQTTDAIAEALRPVIEKRAAEKAVLLNRPVVARDARIMEACRAVAHASDRLEAARYGPDEIRWRRDLDRAAAKLARVMRGGRP